MNRLLFLTLLLTLFSCEKPFMGQDPEDTAVSNFESMWTTVDRKYSFFEYKNINWDSVHTAYRARVYDGMPEKELFDVLAAMLSELRDGHVNLISSFDVSRYSEFSLNSPINFNWGIIERYYLGRNYRTAGPLVNDTIDSVGYIYYGSFGRDINAKELDSIIDRFRPLKGIIIDVRHNGGGSVSNADLLAGRFANEKRLVGAELSKTGPGHNDFSDPMPIYVEPSGKPYTGKVVVLINRRSYSATNDFALRMRAFPHVTLIGDSTGGGGGYPVYAELPNGWTYRFSASQVIDPMGLNVENGIPPDIELDNKPEDEARGVDNILERALEFMKE